MDLTNPTATATLEASGTVAPIRLRSIRRADLRAMYLPAR